MAKRLTQKQETFCLKYFELGNASEAARIAKYSPHTAAVIGRENLLKPKIQGRIDELRQKAEDATIGTMQEREKVLTEIYRGRVGDYLGEDQRIKQGEPLTSAAIQEVITEDVKIGRGEHAQLVAITKLKLNDPVKAIAEHNKMQKIYAVEAGTVIDNRVININVISDKGRELTQRLVEGERTGGDNNH